jgi:hypothetical protein
MVNYQPEREKIRITETATFEYFMIIAAIVVWFIAISEAIYYF